MSDWEIAALIVVVGTPVVVGLVMAGADRLCNHVDVPEPEDPTAPDQTAPGNARHPCPICNRKICTRGEP